MRRRLLEEGEFGPEPGRWYYGNNPPVEYLIEVVKDERLESRNRDLAEMTEAA